MSNISHVLKKMQAAAYLVSDASYQAQIAEYKKQSQQFPRTEDGDVIEDEMTELQMAALDILPLLHAARQFAKCYEQTLREMASPSDLPF